MGKQEDKKYINTRKHLRYKPEPSAVARIDPDNGFKFEAKICGIIISESYSGCAVVIQMTEQLAVGDNCRVQVNENVDPFKAEVIWRKPIDEDILKLGLKFLE